MNYIPRHIADVLIRCARTFPVTLLTGPRQVGKSTALERVFPDIDHVTLDDPLLLNQARTDARLFMINHPAPVLIDEIQYATGLFPHVKMECDRRRENGLYQLTGSQPIHLMKNVTESLAGRVAVLELQGLSLRELTGSDFRMPFVPEKAFVAARRASAAPLKDLWRIIHRGSFPALQDPEVDWEIFYRSYVSTYIERDVSDLAQVKDKGKFLNFLIAMAARTGQMVNHKNVADDVGVSLETIRNWTSILETSGIVYTLEPYAPSALKRAIRTPKIFFRDTGLVCYLTKWMTPEVLAAGHQNGAIFETFVVSEILKSFSNAGRGYRDHVFYYRGKDKNRRRPDGSVEAIESEIDFIVEENGVLHPIEIKMTASPDASMAAAFDVLDVLGEKTRGAGAIVCLYDKPLWLRDQLVVLPVEYL